MRLGFTGTRDGLTVPQSDALTRWLRSHPAPPAELHHGAAIGADNQAVEIAHGRFAGADNHARRLVAFIVAHPPDVDTAVAPRALKVSDRVWAPKPYLDRNRDIVDACEVLVACPGRMHEEQRSGTWMTVRYARRMGKRVVVVWPSGEVTEEAGRGVEDATTVTAAEPAANA